LNRKYDGPLSNFVFNCKLRPCIKKILAKIMMREMYGAFASWADNAGTIVGRRRFTPC